MKRRQVLGTLTASAAGLAALAMGANAFANQEHEHMAHFEACECCAKCCDKCAAVCDTFKDDKHMAMCAKSCRDCAKACREMMKHTAH